jgi:hypothetical protein
MNSKSTCVGSLRYLRMLILCVSRTPSDRMTPGLILEEVTGFVWTCNRDEGLHQQRPGSGQLHERCPSLPGRWKEVRSRTAASPKKVKLGRRGESSLDTRPRSVAFLAWRSASSACRAESLGCYEGRTSWIAGELVTCLPVCVITT